MNVVERLSRTGIRRCGSAASGFRYVDAAGRPVPAAVVERIRSMAIPPAWTDVAVAASPRARVQAVGRDRAGRWQYRYHERCTDHRAHRRQALWFGSRRR